MRRVAAGERGDHQAGVRAQLGSCLGATPGAHPEGSSRTGRWCVLRTRLNFAAQGSIEANLLWAIRIRAPSWRSKRRQTPMTSDFRSTIGTKVLVDDERDLGVATSQPHSQHVENEPRCEPPPAPHEGVVRNGDNVEAL